MSPLKLNFKYDFYLNSSLKMIPKANICILFNFKSQTGENQRVLITELEDVSKVYI